MNTSISINIRRDASYAGMDMLAADGYLITPFAIPSAAVVTVLSAIYYQSALDKPR